MSSHVFGITAAIRFSFSLLIILDSLRKIKQFEVLEMIQFLALKNQIMLSLYNSDSERTEIHNDDIEAILREFHDAPLGACENALVSFLIGKA